MYVRRIGFSYVTEARPAVLKRMYDAEKADLFADTKLRVEMVRNYDFMPLVFVRFQGARNILDVVNEPNVAAIAADHQSRLQLAESLPLEFRSGQ